MLAPLPLRAQRRPMRSLAAARESSVKNTLVEVACWPKSTASTMGMSAPGSLACRNDLRRSLRESAVPGRAPGGALKTKLERRWRVVEKLDGSAAADARLRGLPLAERGNLYL